MQLDSLYDLLYNESMVFEGELVLQIIRNIGQGLRFFLHTATPKVVHGDLKAHNVLVDSKFYAKVAEFGLSRKSQSQRSGTPLWMAPELLRGETRNTPSSDTEKVSNMSDRFFTKFDNLAKLHKAFKVETIGDAYMTVTTLAAEQPEHARITAQFAFDAIKVASSTLIDEDDLC
jgi:serine/threonine protein kinase